MGVALDPARVDHLLRRGSELWREFLANRGGLFHGFIPADHRGAYDRLAEERPRHDSFLELGSGIGLITILADLCGYDAYGIEIDPELYELSCALNEEAEANATFALGSFVPEDFRQNVELMDAEWHTPIEGADGFDELGMDLASFDLVYAYPWPGEEDWIEALVRHGAGSRTQLLTYSVSDGFDLAGPWSDEERG